MNVYLRELRANLRSLIIWCGGMFLFIAAGIMKFSTYETAGQSINELVKQMPPALQGLVGSNYFDLTTASGFFGMLFPYLVFMVTIHAAMLGAGIFAKEERDRTSEFLYVKPLSRTAVFTAKLLAALTSVAVLWLVTWGSSVGFLQPYAKGEDIAHIIALLMAGMLFVQLIFLAIGIASSALTRFPKGAMGIAAFVLLAAFVLAFIIDVNTDLAPLKYITPFKYFQAKDIMDRDGLDGMYVAISSGIVLCLTAASAVVFRRKDMNV